ncbi:MAG: M56 family metallopeptidase, partial [Chitinophagaceae bacterium]
MQDVFQYLLKWSIALGVAYLFYRFMLRPLTFYQWNRRYLVAYSMLAFLIPFVNLYSYVQPGKLQDISLVKYIPVINFQQQPVAVNSFSFLSPMMIAGLLILAGSMVLLVRLIIQWNSLRRIRRTAVPVYHPHANVYHVDENVIPFSFGDAIYVNTALHTEEELNDIILHEFVHVKQKHSFDIIWSEILCILNWYNPFAWLIRHAIRQNLEFIADQAVLNNGLDKKTYQYHLLKVIGSSQYSIANNFNFSSLKKRIAMMNRLKTARVHLVKFLFVLPLLAVLLVAFRNNEGWYQDIKNDTIKKPDAAALAQMKAVMREGFKLIPLDEFYERNPSVKEIAWSSEQEIVLYLKNGTRQAYNSKNADELKKLAVAYGGIPAIYPAPPPPPRTALVAVGTPLPPDDPAAVLPPTAPSEPLPPSEPKLPKGVISLEEENNWVTLKLANGKKEVYDMNKVEVQAAFTKKYGTILRLKELPLEQPVIVEKSLPAVVEVPVTVEKSLPAVVEVPVGTPVMEQVPVIRLEAKNNNKVSVSVVSNVNEQILYSDLIEVRGSVLGINGKAEEARKVVYYV